MKKFLIFLILLVPIVALSGEIVNTPSNIVLSQPTTNVIDKLRLTFFYDQAGNHSCIIWYNVMSNDGTEIVERQSVALVDAADNPDTDVTLCTDIGVPFSCCTGFQAGDCDESSTDFTDFVTGFGATLKSRADAEIWNDIQGKYTTQ